MAVPFVVPGGLSVANVPNAPSWQQCRLTWTLLDWIGDHASVDKTVITSPVQHVNVAPDGLTAVFKQPVITWVNGVMCDESGTPGINVPATLDTDVAPNGFSLTVQVTLTDGRKIRANVATPVGGVLDLSTYVDAPNIPPGSALNVVVASAVDSYLATFSVESPPGSGLYLIPGSAIESPSGSGLYAIPGV